MLIITMGTGCGNGTPDPRSIRYDTIANVADSQSDISSYIVVKKSQ